MNLQIIRDWVYAIPVSKAIQEAILTGLRLVVFAAVSALLTYLLEVIKLMPVQYQAIATMIITLLIQSWDKYKFVANTSKRVEGVDNYGLVGF